MSEHTTDHDAPFRVALEAVRRAASLTRDDFTLSPVPDPADQGAPARHLGNKANAENCPACEVEQRDLTYPWLCPAEPGDSVIPPAAGDTTRGGDS